MKSLDLNALLTELSVIQKMGELKLSRKINTYTIENPKKSGGQNVFTFICGAVTENLAFDFKMDGKSIMVESIDAFLQRIESLYTNGQQMPAPDVNENDYDDLSEVYDDLSEVPEEKIVEVKTKIQGTFKSQKEIKKMTQQKLENFDESDLDEAAAAFAQAIKQRQSENKNVNEKISALEEMIKNIGAPQPKEIIINDLPKVDLGENACAIIDDLLRAAYTRQNAYIFGPAGCGKTTAAKQVAKAMSLPFGYICLTAGASETWLFGRNTPNGFIEGQFSLLYKNGGVFLADEMDAADSNLLIALNTAIDSDQLLNPMSGEVIKKHKDFVFIGAGNTNGLGATGNYNGRNRQDGSTLSRFVFFEMDYNEQLEKALCLCPNIYKALIETRQYLKNRKSENFITTRDFIKLSKMFIAGSTYEFCVNSLTANFSEVERQEVKKFWQFKTPKKQKAVTQDEIPF